ncbi:MFS transporter [Sulfitobacter sp. F26204]|uniref:MFS transporter n=1 Tax=Sulfitobacter sp. F26204 TaxID=2996014 RepID=UPI00225DD2B9|nr:MFS transporter [Sulfitobacter sp. F26204]MCX7561086.1 MFS transporter [Sulfitobacter sp. F26204]
MNLKTDLYLSRRPLAGFLAIGAAWSVYFAQMPVIKAQVGASDGAYGVALLVAAFGAFAAMWLAPACRRLAGDYAMPLGIVVIAIGMLGAGFATSLVTLTLAMMLASAGSGVVDVLVNARVSEIEETSGRDLMNLNHALYAFAYAAGALATGALRQAGVTPVPIFAILFILLLVAGISARDRIPPVDTQQGENIAAFPVLLVILTGGIVLIAFLTEASTEGWSALHIERTLLGEPGHGALGPAALGLMMGIGRLGGHALARRIRDTTLMMMATLFAASGVALAGMASTVAVALLGFALAGLGISVVVPLAMALIGRVVPQSQRMAAISRVSVIGYGAFFFGPPLMGLVAENFGLRMAFVAIAALLALTATILIPAVARRAS